MECVLNYDLLQHPTNKNLHESKNTCNNVVFILNELGQPFSELSLTIQRVSGTKIMIKYTK